MQQGGGRRRRGGLTVRVSGIPPLGHLSFLAAPQPGATLFTQSMLDRGFLAGKAFYVSFAHTDEMIGDYLGGGAGELRIVAAALAEGSVESRLRGPVAQTGFAPATLTLTSNAPEKQGAHGWQPRWITAASHPIRSVDRVCDVLDTLANSPTGATLGEVAEATSLPKSSAFRYLTALAARHYVERDADAVVFRLGPAFRPQHTRRMDRLSGCAHRCWSSCVTGWARPPTWACSTGRWSATRSSARAAK